MELSNVTSIKKDPWAGFKRKHAEKIPVTENVKVRKQQVSSSIQPKKDQPNPHICLKCGTELTRGRESYKIRHWQQKHKNEDPKNSLTNIVPKDHESARKLLARNKGREKHKETVDAKDEECITKTIIPSENNHDHEDKDNRL